MALYRQNCTQFPGIKKYHQWLLRAICLGHVPKQCPDQRHSCLSAGLCVLAAGIATGGWAEHIGSAQGDWAWSTLYCCVRTWGYNN
eukprot:2311471-Rhodomonas_salina.1